MTISNCHLECIYKEPRGDGYRLRDTGYVKGSHHFGEEQRGAPFLGLGLPHGAAADCLEQVKVTKWGFYYVLLVIWWRYRD